MKSLFLALIFGSLFAVDVAYTCDYSIDEVKMKKVLASVAEAATRQTKIAVAVSKFKFFESKPTPMCPAEMTYEAIVTVQEANCIANLKVVMVEPWGNPQREVKFSISGFQSERCNRL